MYKVDIFFQNYKVEIYVTFIHSMDEPSFSRTMDEEAYCDHFQEIKHSCSSRDIAKFNHQAFSKQIYHHLKLIWMRSKHGNF